MTDNDKNIDVCDDCKTTECVDLAKEYHDIMRDHASHLAKNNLICRQTKIHLLDQLAFKIACISAFFQTNVNPKIFEDYSLIMIPKNRVDEVEKILGTAYTNSIKEKVEKGLAENVQ